MATIHRICAACGKDSPLDSRHCPHCGHDTQSGLPMRQSSNLPAVVGKAAVPMLVTAGTLAARLLWKVLRERMASAGPLAMERRPAQPVAQGDAQVQSARRRRSIHIRSSWAVGDANGVWRQGQTEHHIEIDE